MSLDQALAHANCSIDIGHRHCSAETRGDKLQPQGSQITYIRPHTENSVNQLLALKHQGSSEKFTLQMKLSGPTLLHGSRQRELSRNSPHLVCHSPCHPLLCTHACFIPFTGCLAPASRSSLTLVQMTSRPVRPQWCLSRREGGRNTGVLTWGLLPRELMPGRGGGTARDWRWGVPEGV